MIRQLAALCATTTLLTTALPATHSTAAEPAACVKTTLPLPADAAPGVSLVRDADPSGRYIIGHASRQGRQSSQGLLWVDGVPRWLGSKPDSESYGWAIAKGGLVLGTSGNLAGTDYWVYSIKTDSYRILEVPAGLDIYTLTGMNAHQDIIGLAWDDESQYTAHAFVWPAGGQPRLLPTPKGTKVFSVEDISDEGRIIGSVGHPDASDITSYLWNSWNSRPTRLSGLHLDSVYARDIEGTRIGGEEGTGSSSTGFIWNTRGRRTAQLEDAVADLNSSGDAVTVGDDILDPFPSVLVRSNGTRLTFPEGTMLTHIFNRNTPWTAGGYENNPDGMSAIVYTCGS